MNHRTNYWDALSPSIFLITAALSNPGTTHGEAYFDAVLLDNPVAYYSLEERPGEVTAIDSSASGSFPGVYYSSAQGYPKMGQPGIGTNAVYFRSDSGHSQYSYVEVPFAPELNPPGAFSVEAWVRPMSLPTGGEYRSPLGNFQGWVAGYPGWFFYQTPESDGNPSRWVWVMEGGAIWIQSEGVTEYKWDYLAATFDGVRASFYLNGELVDSAEVPGYVPSSTASTYIGGNPVGQWPWDGYIDEVAIYGTALSEDQIRIHYETGTTNFRAVALPPEIIQNPADIHQYAGRTVKFSVSADGTPPLSYQWYRGASAIAGATDDSLGFASEAGDDAATYRVVVTNPYGSAQSEPATLTVSKDLVVASNPVSVTRNEGSTAAFNVRTDGALPMTYQWYKGSNPIPGATGATLCLKNIRLSDDATLYHASISNAWTNKSSATAMLSVVPRAETFPITGYAKLVIQDQPVGYWRLDEAKGSTVAVDAVGSFDGDYDAAGAGSHTAGSFTFNEPTGIPFETDAAISVSGGARVAAPWALELNPDGPFTAEAWLKPASLGVNSTDYRTAISSEGYGVSGPTGWLLYQQPDNTWSWVLYGDNWVSTFINDATDVITSNTWYHVALAYDGSSFNLYVNGKLAASQAWEAFVPNANGKANFGWRSLNDYNPFDGTIDEVAFYDKALTPTQVVEHYTGSVQIAISRESGRIVLSWPFGILQRADTLNGAFVDELAATSPYTNAPAPGARFFRVRVK